MPSVRQQGRPAAHETAHELRPERMLVKRRTEVARAVASSACSSGGSPCREDFGLLFDEGLAVMGAALISERTGAGR